jgi:hypothetical protein
MALATSSAWPTRRNGKFWLNTAISRPLCSKSFEALGVAIMPGATQLTRTPYGPHSAAATRVNIWIAALAAE